MATSASAAAMQAFEACKSPGVYSRVIDIVASSVLQVSQSQSLLSIHAAPNSSCVRQGRCQDLPLSVPFRFRRISLIDGSQSVCCIFGNTKKPSATANLLLM